MRHVTFHGLFVEAIKGEARGGRRAKGAGSGDTADCLQGVREDAVCVRKLEEGGGKYLVGWEVGYQQSRTLLLARRRRSKESSDKVRRPWM